MWRAAASILWAVGLASGLWGCGSARCTDAPGAAPVITARAYIEAPYDEVWARFTEAAMYEAWYSSPCVAFGAAPGEACVWGWPERVTYEGEVLWIERGRGVAHTFDFVGFGFDDEPPTPVEILIEDARPTVLVTLRHDCAGAPRTYEMISDVGWQKSISRLKTLLETGRPMPWPGAEGE